MVNITEFYTSSANDTYETINEALKEINKKIFVFVDDLDRLNQEEILQVLKLIRNTANFKNTVFVVAMDKGYILNRLSNDDVILNSRFIDKFFQLEIYLPEIDQSILIEEFKNILTSSSIFKSEQIEIEFENIINLNKILFNDYITNLRDVKRVCNQIIFEYEFINEEIKLEDFMNFILLKLNFPEFINKLKRTPLLYLEKSSNYYTLISSNSNIKIGDGADVINIDLQKIKYQDYKKYDIYNQFFIEDKVGREEILKLTDDEKFLLIKTLITLFGQENALTPNSIKFENNFRRFMQLNYKSSDFLNKNFSEIIEKKDVIDIKKQIENIIQNNQQFELLDRIKYYTPLDNDKLKTAIIIYFSLFDTIDNNKLPEYDILRNFGVLTIIHISENKDQHFTNEISNWFISEIIDSKNFKIATQLKLLGYLWEIKKTEKLWEIETSTLEEIGIKKFKKYLSKYDGSFWKVDDNTFYKIYNTLKVIGNLKGQLVKDFKDFLNNNTIAIFCVQSTDFDSFEDHVYAITDSVIEFFGSKQNFKTFVENHKERDTPEIKEYVQFLELFDITNFSIRISYKFKKLEAFALKAESIKLKNNDFQYEKYNKINQIFLHVKNEIDFNYVKNANLFDDSNYRISDFKSFIYKNKFYLVLTYFYGKDDNHDIKYMNKIYGYLQNIHPNSLTMSYKNPKIKKEEFSIKLDNKVILDIHSIQPF
jgi:hypothetical protein